MHYLYDLLLPSIFFCSTFSAETNRTTIDWETRIWFSFFSFFLFLWLVLNFPLNCSKSLISRSCKSFLTTFNPIIWSFGLKMSLKQCLYSGLWLDSVLEACYLDIGASVKSMKSMFNCIHNGFKQTGLVLNLLKPAFTLTSAPDTTPPHFWIVLCGTFSGLWSSLSHWRWRLVLSCVFSVWFFFFLFLSFFLLVGPLVDVCDSLQVLGGQ